MNNIQTLFAASLTLLAGFFSPHPQIKSPLPDVLGVTIEKPSPTSTLDPTPTDTPVPTPTTTSEPTATPSPSPTPTPIPQAIYTPQQIDQFFDNASHQYAVNVELLRRIARCESGYNSSSRNLGYGGMFQFSSGTWQSYRAIMNKDPDPSLRFDAKEAIDTAAYMISIGKSGNWPLCAVASG